ncbi:heme peroxidase [Cylindrobasidium torrendii FP15055 ss-10]|uniref:Peroxidase n=1 Tax=Cylindrobasidium torrendii FP15055 ss-10 TaxID=1314674 RepID=A0A0D7B1N0_9AGAR|nr:heme peroxidase [Cylindrobasidium torrendii FP15055 ss-10]
MTRLLATSLALANSVLAYTWPSPQLDRLESLRWDQDGYNSFEAASFVKPCDRYTLSERDKGTAGLRTNAGDWIRTAYHDMAPHDKTAGTGGLDASIRFWEEQARPENPGNHWNNSILFIGGALDRHFSLADGIALLAVLATENCGGPEIDFRGGRVDATEPNNAGVPEPDQDIESFVESFDRQGFTKEEMIALVACGHAIGSVQSKVFPDVVAESPNGTEYDSGVGFDSTMATFDNAVAVEYVDGTTQNPLVVGLNATKNSDLRVFQSDGNKTITALAEDADLFATTCASLMARMIDTVPKGVELTEVIRPLPVKPYQLKLTYLKNGTVKLSGEVRLFDSTENDKRTVELVWTDATCADDEAECEEHRVSLAHTSSMVSSAQALRYTNLWYGHPTFLATIDPTKGFREFHFEVDEGDGEVRKLDQDGAGFVLPTDAVMLSETMCGNTLAVAVCDDASITRVFIEADNIRGDISQAPARVIELERSGDADANGFVLWTTTIEETVPSYGFGIVAEINGERVELPQDNRSTFC